MAEAVRLANPRSLEQNPENPRLIFRADELETLEDSIKNQGILVPLTVYETRRERLILLDGERRWRCAIKLGLPRVPVIVQPEPDRLANIMMMFAIHNTRRDWDPLPTAYKLQELEEEFTDRNGRSPNELELAELASIGRGEVRRLKKLLNLPQKYRAELMRELEKPRSQQLITVDHVLEATKGAEALRKRGILDRREEDRLRGVILRKFRSGVIKNTVAPRQLARIARAVQRDEVPVRVAKRVTDRLISDPAYSIDDAFQASVARVDFEHTVEQLSQRLLQRLETHEDRDYPIGEGLRESLEELAAVIRRLLRS